MDVELPKLAFAGVALLPAGEPTRRKPTPALDLDRVISIGGPEIVPITLDDIGADDEIRPFVAARAAEYSFHLLHLACTVMHQTDVLLTRVSLAMELSQFDPQAKPAPLALSMSPRQLDRPVELSRSLSLTAPLKIVDVGVDVGRTIMAADVYVQAENELRSDPRWELYRTESVALKGLQRFAMIVQAPRPGGQGTLTVRATAKHRSWGAYRNPADYETPTPQQFTFAS